MVQENVRDDGFEELAPSRYVVGIDLGTTNSAVSYVDTSKAKWAIRPYAVRQLVAAGEIEARRTLPSFHYQPAAGELPDDALRLPWKKEPSPYAVGFFARDQGAVAPGRLIASAKSWLCHTGVDRTADLLPWQGFADVDRLSPIDVSARYLRHVRDAWDAEHPRDPLSEQDIVLTLPASFDEVARELTVEAAARAGLPRIVLIEEPQAAFYAWIYKHQDDWDTSVEPGQKILVCDVGGGTSDFTLIQVRRGESGKVVFHRVAVGDHLILGGDNLDLALAHHLEEKLGGKGKLQPRQWSVLVRVCRQVKESLLAAGAPQKTTVSLPAAGAKLIGGALQIEVTRKEVESLLVDGFLPHVKLDDRPQSRGSGFQEFGLPFAPDAAITRYLAAFLSAHRDVTVEDDPLPTEHDSARPDVVLLNGGLFESPVLRQRMLDAICSWFRGKEKAAPWRPCVLEGDDLDLAVARGAAYYGMVRRGEGVRIAAGLARTYYVGVEAEQPAAVCLLPASVEPGHDVHVTDRQFELRVSQPVEFPLFVSSTRLTDKAGELLRVDPESMVTLPPIRTVLQTRRRRDAGSVRVGLHARLTEIGTVDLWCSDVEQTHRWRLQFDVRSATQTDLEAHLGAGETQGFVDEETWDRCHGVLCDTFGQHGQAKPQTLVKTLTECVGRDRDQWPMSLLRRIWDTLMELESGRRNSAAHEARWLNLLGYALRPGYGLALDDWRVAETWRTVQGKVIHGAAASRNESWILWRRIAGGLGAGQQRAAAEPLLAPVRSLHRSLTTGRGRGDLRVGVHESVELWRLLGSLELLSVPLKIELGNMLCDMLVKPKLKPVRPALAWTIGRLGARNPVYGPLNTVVPREQSAQWLSAIMKEKSPQPAELLAVMQLARRTEDRYRDLPDELRGDVVSWLRSHDAPRHFVDLVREGGQLDVEEQGRVFGESLPVGLRIA